MAVGCQREKQLPALQQEKNMKSVLPNKLTSHHLLVEPGTFQNIPEKPLRH